MYLVQHESFHSSWRAGLLRIRSCLDIKASKNSSSYINNMRLARYGAHAKVSSITQNRTTYTR